MSVELLKILVTSGVSFTNLPGEEVWNRESLCRVNTSWIKPANREMGRERIDRWYHETRVQERAKW